MSHKLKDDYDDDDDISLADIMSLRISTPIKEEKQMYMRWTLQQQHEIYQQQLQASYYQLHYLQQQQMMSMMRQSTSSSRRSSTVSSASSRYRSQPSPSPSNSSVKRHARRPPPPPPPIHNESIKRRQSLGKRIKKVFGMTEQQPDSIPKSASFKKKDYSLPSPAPSTVSTSSTIQSESTNTSNSSKKSLSFNPIIQLHETFSASEYDRRCDTDTTCQKLTPVLALQIKEELNHFKLNDMFVHLDSRQYTHFFM